MKQLHELITEIKRDILLEILVKLKDIAMPYEKARDIAAAYVSSGPFESIEDAIEKLNRLADQFPEVRNVYLKYAKPYYEEKRVCLITNIRAAVEQGDIDGAVQKAYWRCAQ